MGINKIILGSAQFGFKYGINNLGSRLNENDVSEILEHAFSEGIRYIDSAEAYGNAHKLIGQFHNKNKSNRFNIITKFKNLNLKSDDDLISHVEKTCESLFVDYIHTYMFHSFSDFKKNLKIYDELKLLKNKGLIKKIGISIYENYQIDYIINTSIILILFNCHSIF